MHPMELKARSEYVEALKCKSPIQWLMMNHEGLRNVTEAINKLGKDALKYPDIAEKYNAEQVVQEELAFERQLVLDARNQTEAVSTLCEWYNRPSTQMTRRYKAIMDEAERMPKMDLDAERRDFVTKETKSGTPRPQRHQKDEPFAPNDYYALAKTNINKRLNALMELKANLGEELNDDRGKLGELRRKMNELESQIQAFEIVKTNIKEEKA